MKHLKEVWCAENLHQRLSVQPRVDKQIPQESCSHDQQSLANPPEIRHCRGRREKNHSWNGPWCWIEHMDLGMSCRSWELQTADVPTPLPQPLLQKIQVYNKASKPSGTLNTQDQPLKHSISSSSLTIKTSLNIFFLFR